MEGYKHRIMDSLLGIQAFVQRLQFVLQMH